jgi:hypothetical protein
MSKQITYLTLFILACYSQNAFCEWIKVKSEDERELGFSKNIIKSCR